MSAAPGGKPKLFLPGVLAIKCGTSGLREYGFTGWKQKSLDNYQPPEDAAGDESELEDALQTLKNARGKIRGLFGLEFDYSTFPFVRVATVRPNSRAAKSGVTAGDYVATINDTYLISDIVKFVPKSKDDPVPQSPDEAIWLKLREKAKAAGGPDKTPWGFIFFRKKYATGYCSVEYTAATILPGSVELGTAADGKTKTVRLTADGVGGMMPIKPSGAVVAGDELLVVGDKFTVGRDATAISELLKKEKHALVRRKEGEQFSLEVGQQHYDVYDLAADWSSKYAPLAKIGIGGDSPAVSRMAAGRSAAVKQSSKPPGGGGTGGGGAGTPRTGAASPTAGPGAAAEEKIVIPSKEAPFQLSLFAASQSASTFSTTLLGYEQKFDSPDQMKALEEIVAKKSEEMSSGMKLLMAFGFELDFRRYPLLPVKRLLPVTPRGGKNTNRVVEKKLSVGDYLLLLGGERVTMLPKMEGKTAEAAILAFLYKKVKKHSKVMLIWGKKASEKEFLQVSFEQKGVATGIKSFGNFQKGDVKDLEPGSWAADKMKLQAKDEVQMINDKPPRKMTAEEITKILSAEGARPLSLLMRRRGAGFDAKLKAQVGVNIYRKLPSNFMEGLRVRKRIPDQLKTLNGTKVNIGPDPTRAGAAASPAAASPGNQQTAAPEEAVASQYPAAAAGVGAADGKDGGGDPGAEDSMAGGPLPQGVFNANFPPPEQNINAHFALRQGYRREMFTAEQFLHQQHRSEMQNFLADSVRTIEPEEKKRAQRARERGAASERSLSERDIIPPLQIPLQPFAFANDPVGGTTARTSERTPADDAAADDHDEDGDAQQHAIPDEDLYVTSYLRTLEERAILTSTQLGDGDPRFRGVDSDSFKRIHPELATLLEEPRLYDPARAEQQFAKLQKKYKAVLDSRSALGRFQDVMRMSAPSSVLNVPSYLAHPGHLVAGVQRDIGGRTNARLGDLTGASAGGENFNVNTVTDLANGFGLAGGGITEAPGRQFDAWFDPHTTWTGAANKTRPVPPSISSLTQKDGLDIQFMHLMSAGEKMVSTTGELSRKMTQALNEMTSQQLLDANFITPNEKEMMREQEAKRMEQERYKEELREQVRDEEHAQFYAERHARMNYYESMFDGRERDEEKSESDPTELDADDVIVVPLNAKTGELEIPLTKEKPEWQKKIDEQQGPSMVVLAPAAMRAERKEVRRGVFEQIASPAGGNANSPNGVDFELDDAALTLGIDKKMTGADFLKMKSKSKGKTDDDEDDGNRPGGLDSANAGAAVDVDVHALENIANLFRIPLTSVIVRLRVCTEQQGDPCVWSCHLHGGVTKPSEKQQDAIIVEKRFGAISSTFDNSLVPFYRRLFFLLEKEKCPTEKTTLWFHLTFFERKRPSDADAEGGSSSPEERNQDSLEGRVSGKLRFDEKDPLAQVGIRVRDSQHSHKVHQVQPIYSYDRTSCWSHHNSHKGSRLVQAFGSEATLRARVVARDPGTNLIEFPGMSPISKIQMGRGVLQQVEPPQSWNTTTGATGDSIGALNGRTQLSQLGTVGRVKEWDARGVEEVPLNALMRDNAAQSHVAALAAPQYDEYVAEKRDMDDERDAEMRRRYREASAGGSAAAGAGGTSPGGNTRGLSPSSAAAGAAAGGLADHRMGAAADMFGGTGDQAEAFLQGESADEGEDDDETKRGPSIEELAKKKLGNTKERARLEEVVRDKRDEERVRAFMKKEAAEELMRVRKKRMAAMADQAGAPQSILSASEAMKLTAGEKVSLRQAVKTAGQAEMRRLKAERTEHGALPIVEYELLEAAIDEIQKADEAGKTGGANNVGFLFYGEKDSKSSTKAGGNKKQKVKKKKKPGALPCFDSETDEEATKADAEEKERVAHEKAEQEEAKRRQEIEDGKKKPAHLDGRWTNLSAAQSAMKDQIALEAAKRIKVDEPEIDILDTLEHGEIPAPALLQQCAQHAHNEHMENLEERQVKHAAAFEHYEEHAKQAAASPLLATAYLGEGGDVADGDDTLDQMNLFFGAESKAEKARKERLEQVQKDLRAKDAKKKFSSKDERKKALIVNPKDLKFPKKIQWVGIPLPTVKPLEPDLGACLIDNFDLELLPDAEDALDFRNVLERLRHIDTVYDTLDFKNFKRFRYSMGELYSTLFNMQHDGRLGNVPGKNIGTDAQARATVQTQAQLILEYAIAIAREPRLPFGGLASQLTALLIDCLRRFPKNPFLHYWGVEALLNVVRQQKNMDKLVSVEKLEREKKFDLRMVRNMSNNLGSVSLNAGTANNAPYWLLQILPYSKDAKQLGLAMWAQTSLNPKVLKTKNRTGRQKFAALFGMALDWRKYPKVRVVKVVEKDVMEPSKPSRAFKAKVGKGDCLVIINDRAISEIGAALGYDEERKKIYDDPHDAVLDDCVKRLAMRKPITFWFVRYKFQQQYLQLELDSPNSGFEMEYEKNYVIDVQKGGWADKRGIKAGDKVIAVGKHLVEVNDLLAEKLAKAKKKKAKKKGEGVEDDKDSEEEGAESEPDEFKLRHGFPSREALEKTIEDQLDIIGPRPLSILFRRGDRGYTNKHHKQAASYALQLPSGWLDADDAGKKTVADKTTATTRFFQKEEIKDSYDKSTVEWNRMLFFPEGNDEEGGPAGEVVGGFLEGLKRGGAAGMNLGANKNKSADPPLMVTQLALSRKPKEMGVAGWQVAASEVDIEILRDPEVEARDKMLHVFGFQLDWSLYPVVKVLRVEKWLPDESDKTKAWKFQIHAGDSMILVDGRPVTEVHFWNGVDPDDAILKRVVKNFEANIKEPPTAIVASFMFLRQEFSKQYAQLECKRFGDLGFANNAVVIGDGNRTAEEEMFPPIKLDPETGMPIIDEETGQPVYLPRPDPPAAGTILEINDIDLEAVSQPEAWIVKYGIEEGDRLLAIYDLKTGNSAFAERDFGGMMQMLGKYYENRPLYFLFRRCVLPPDPDDPDGLGGKQLTPKEKYERLRKAKGFPKKLLLALPAPKYMMPAPWKIRLTDIETQEKELRRKQLVDLDDPTRLTGTGVPRSPKSLQKKGAAGDAPAAGESDSGDSDYPHVDASVPVAMHRHQFQIAVFHFLHVPMRIEEEMLQWKVLDALAETIHPDCLIVHDHLDFALDLLKGKEQIARRLEAEERAALEADGNKTKEYRDLMDEVVAITAGLATSGPGGKTSSIPGGVVGKGGAQGAQDDAFMEKYKAVISELKSEEVDLARYYDEKLLRQERQRFLTLATYESFFAVLMVARSAHRILEQHAYCMRALLRFKASPRLLLRALLVLGNLYEIAISFFGNARLLLRPTVTEENELNGPHATTAVPLFRPKRQQRELEALQMAVTENTCLMEDNFEADLLLDDPSAKSGLRFDITTAGFNPSGSPSPKNKFAKQAAKKVDDVELAKNPILAPRTSSLLELLTQILDVVPDNRKVTGATIRVIALLCAMAKSQVVHTAKFGLRAINLAVKRHPDSQSVLKHALQVFHACAIHDQRLGASLADVLRTLLAMAGLLQKDLEAREYLVNTLRILAEGAENVDEYEAVIAQSYLNMLDHFLADEKTLHEHKIVIPCLETLALLSHENALLRQYVLPGVKHALRILNEDRLPLIVQAKAANCLKVLAMAAGYPVLETLLLDNLQKSNGLATIFKSGKKYISASTPLCLELLSTLANLFYCRTLRDLVFGKDKVDQSYNTVEWVISLMEENGVQDVDVVGFRLFGSLTRYEEDEKLEEETIERFVLTDENMQRLRLLVMNCLCLRNVGVPPFDFLERLARQQLAGRPLSGRILTADGEVLLEEHTTRENFWVA